MAIYVKRYDIERILFENYHFKLIYILVIQFNKIKDKCKRNSSNKVEISKQNNNKVIPILLTIGIFENYKTITKFQVLNSLGIDQNPTYFPIHPSRPLYLEKAVHNKTQVRYLYLLSGAVSSWQYPAGEADMCGRHILTTVPKCQCLSWDRGTVKGGRLADLRGADTREWE